MAFITKLFVALVSLVVASAYPAKFVGDRTMAYAKNMAQGGNGAGPQGTVTSPFAKDDLTRSGVRANKLATKYAASKARKEEYYAARKLKQDDQFAARRAQRATHFQAWQEAHKGQQQVRKLIRAAKW